MGLLDEKNQITYVLQGFTTGNEKDVFQGKRLKVYMDLDKTQYDDVFILTDENTTYQFDFGDKTTKLETTQIFAEPSYSEPLVLRKEFLTVDYAPKENAPKTSKNRVHLYLKIAYVALFAMNAYAVFFTQSNFYLVIAAFVLAAWFFSDYEMLQNRKHFAQVLLLSSVFALNGQLLLLITPPEYYTVLNDLLLIFLPVFFLICQYGARKLFLSVFHREPKVDRPAPSVADFFYMMFIIIVPLLLVFLFPQ
jgi:hypothetical protein